MTLSQIEILREAWRQGLTEFIALDPTEDGKSQLTNLLEVINNIRQYRLLRECKNETFVSRVYDDIRSVEQFYIMLMSAATTFCLAIDDIAQSIDYFVNRVIMYSDKSNVVDSLQLQLRAPDTALKTIIDQNQWLYMLLVASVLESTTLEVLMTLGRKK